MFFSVPPIIDKNKLATFSTIAYPSKYNYRQTINDCGPFSVAAVIRALTTKEIDTSDIVQDISWRLPNGYTIPWGVEDQLKEHDLTMEIPNVKKLNDIEKITFLKERLSQGYPIIILGERDYYEHYLTLLGFDSTKDEFYLYDSFYDKGEEGFTIDSNGELPGNRNYTYEQLLDFWRGGGMYGFFNWYAIVAKV